MKRCQLKSGLCNGMELVAVRLRVPRRVNIFEEEARLLCHGCRTFRWGAFKYVSAGELVQQSL